MHQVIVEGLAPATRYRYRACTADRCTGDLHMTTAPPKGSPVRIAAYGDSRSDPERHAEIASRIAAEHPSLVVNVGDIVQEGTAREQYKTMHFDPTRALGQHVPIYVAIGNHEALAPSFFEYMMFPSRPDDPLSEASYGIRWGDAYLLVVDTTNVFYPAGAFEPPIWKWLTKELESAAARTARWRFAFFHYPPDSFCETEADSDSSIMGVRKHLVPLLRDKGFHVVFTGHVHAYERLDYDGLPVLITGGGGVDLEPPDNCGNSPPESKAFAAMHHFVTLDVSCDETSLRVIDVDGVERERIRIEPKGGYRVEVGL